MNTHNKVSKVSKIVSVKQKESFDSETIETFNDLKTNLLIIKFPFKDSKCQSYEKFNIKLFETSNTQNSSLFNHIVYYLLINISFEYRFQDQNLNNNYDIYNQLALCYPVITLNELKIFKDKVYSIIKQLENDKIIEENTLIGKSILDNPIGSRAIQFLYILSEKVLISRLPSNVNILQKPKTIMANRIITTHINILTDDLINKVSTMNELHDQTKKYYSELTCEEENLIKDINLFKSKINNLMKKGILKNEDELSAINRMVKIDHYNIFFNNLQDVYSKLSSRFNNCNNLKENCIENENSNYRHLSTIDKVESIISNQYYEKLSLNKELLNKINSESTEDNMLFDEKLKHLFNLILSLYDTNDISLKESMMFKINQLIKNK